MARAVWVILIVMGGLAFFWLILLRIFAKMSRPGPCPHAFAWLVDNPLRRRYMLSLLDRVGIQPGERVLELFNTLAKRKVPQGSFRRFWIMGGINAQITGAYIAGWIRNWFLSAREKEKRRMETHLQVAVKLLGGMGYLRGVFMKAGQFISNFPHVVPKHSKVAGSTVPDQHFHTPGNPGTDWTSLSPEGKGKCFEALS